MKITNFWPLNENINKCIITEAENASEAVFLSVHRPIRLMRRSTDNPTDEARKTEKDLLRAFLTKDIPTGTLLMPILGSSGIGKSHMIRWLDAQLGRRPDAATRHIIRIPKSASLKRVLELILERLSGKQYDEIRKALKTARDNLDSLQATEELRAKLRIALERASQNASDKITNARRNNLEPDNLDKCICAHAGKDCLQAYISDPVIALHFDKLLSEIAERVTTGAQDGVEKKTQFTLKDMDLGENVRINEASRPAQMYHKLLSREKNRMDAVDVLNRVIDPAIYELLDLGANSLTELFAKVREELQKEGRELVLLVEDFAVLAGIQGALLDVMIKEAVRDGKQVLCTMRTALAVTEGYLANRQTVQTRARYEWFIEETPFEHEKEALDYVEGFVGGYLNAARVGYNKLEKEYKKSGGDELTSWIPSFEKDAGLEPDDNLMLDCFGRSDQGYSIFPFNRAAIRQLMIRYDMWNPDTGKFFVNPRAIINKIIRDTLINYFDDFKNGEFPPVNFHDYTKKRDMLLKPDVQEEIRKRCQDDNERRRYEALLAFWGDSPAGKDKINIPEKLCAVFELPPRFGEFIPPPPSSPPPSPTGGKSSTATGDQPIQNAPIKKEIEKWNRTLNNWAQDIEIQQTDANNLRKWIMAGVEGFIDWDRELIKPPDMDHRRIFIPCARGGLPGGTCDNAMVVLCSEDERKNTDDPTLRLNIMTVIKYNLHEGWDYPEGINDFARYANFMESLSSQMVDYHRRKFMNIDGDTVPVLSQALALGAKILNLDNAHSNEDAAIMDAIFRSATMQPQAVEQGSEKWELLEKECYDKRQGVLEMLVLQVSARQGGASKIHAIDAGRILSSSKVAAKSAKIDVECPDKVAPVLKGHINYLSKYTEAAISEKIERFMKLRTRLDSWLGVGFNKDDVADQLRNTLLASRNAGLGTPAESISTDVLLKKIKEFRESAFMENYELLSKLGAVDKKAPSTFIAILSKMDGKVLTQACETMALCDEAISVFENSVKTKMAVFGQDPVVGPSQSIEKLFSRLDKALIDMQ